MSSSKLIDYLKTLSLDQLDEVKTFMRSDEVRARYTERYEYNESQRQPDELMSKNIREYLHTITMSQLQMFNDNKGDICLGDKFDEVGLNVKKLNNQQSDCLCTVLTNKLYFYLIDEELQLRS